MTTDPKAYHQESKHGYQRFAPSPGFLDWDTQPDPFRLFHGATHLKLPFLQRDPKATAEHLFVGGLPAGDIHINVIAALLELSMGLSTWKEVPGSRWALRMNPSSGNLHPTEAYLVIGNCSGLDPGVYHYAPYDHCLEQRCVLPDLKLDKGFLISLTSIFWRESWKYGERAFRYCLLDVGHAMAALRFAANLLGWQVKVCEAGDDLLSEFLGFTKTHWQHGESEHPDVLLWVGEGDPPKTGILQLKGVCSQADFAGSPNQLSSNHHHWERIYEVAAATKRSGMLTTPHWVTAPFRGQQYEDSGAAIIRRRRSAVDMEIQTSRLARKQFYSILDVLLPRQHCAPFDVALGDSRVHPVFFLHNVQGMNPGLYIQVRNQQHLAELRQLLHPDFLWEPVVPELAFYRLLPGDMRAAAAQLSCGQEICGKGAFAVSMPARFGPELDEDAGRYRELYWEAGCIGQALYLQAEIHGLRGTGIGCFFDDPVHSFLGIRTNDYQAIYHFTVGSPVEDTRISSRAPYFHVKDRLQD